MQEYIDNFSELQRHLGGSPATSYTFYLPLNYNDGQEIPLDLLLQAQNRILDYTDGLTRYAPGRGLWQPSHLNKLYRDPLVPIQTISADPEADFHFASLSAELAMPLEQVQIFLFAQQVYLIK